MQITNAKPKVQLFPKNWETLSLAWPLVVFLGCSLLFFSDSKGSKITENAIQFIASFVFLNVTHGILSIYIIAYFPEARAWLEGYTPKERQRLYLKWAALLVALLVAVYCTLTLGTRIPWPLLLLWAFGTKLIGGFHHTLSQIRGLSSAYSFTAASHFSFTETQLHEHRRRDKIENYLFKAMFFLAAVDLGFRLHDDSSRFYILPVAMLFTYVAILYNSFKFPFARQSTKTFYLFRLIFYPLGAFDYRYLLGIQFIHGIEHTMLFFNMWSKSGVRSEVDKNYIWSLLVPVTVLFGLLSVFRAPRGFGIEFAEFYPQYSALIVGLAAFSTAINYFHFYLDREIFRMRDKRVRDNIGPLIVGESSAAQPLTVHRRVFQNISL